MKWLVRSSRDTICSCDCADVDAVSSPPGSAQMDCPWCGCGFLTLCISCSEAFTYARCVEVPLTAEEVVARWHRGSLGRDCSADDLVEYSGMLREVAEPLVLGVEYVTLDGRLLDLREAARFVGKYAEHALAVLPHATYRRDKKGLCAALDRSYWVERATGAGRAGAFTR